MVISAATVVGRRVTASEGSIVEDRTGLDDLDRNPIVGSPQMTASGEEYIWFLARSV